MTDALPAFPPAEAIANLSPEARATAAEAFIRAGNPAEAVNKAFGISQQQTQPDKPTLDAVDRERLRTGLTSREVAEGVQRLKANWTGKPEDLQAALAKVGLDTVAPPDVQKLNLQQAEKEADLALKAPNDPNEYRIIFSPERAASVSVEELAALRTEISEAFQTAGVPINLGASLADELFESADAFPPIGPAREDYNADQKTMLAKVGDYEELITLASLPLGRMPKETADMLLSNGALQSARAIVALANVGRALMAKEARAKK